MNSQLCQQINDDTNMFPACYFENFSKRAGELRSLTKFADDAKNGAYKSQVEAVRNATGAEREALKKALPGYALCAYTFNGERPSRENALTVPNGLFTIDIDGFANASDAARVRDALAHDASVVIAAISCGGCGVFALVNLGADFQMECTNAEKAAEIWRVYSGIIQRATGIECTVGAKKGYTGPHIDIACKDFARLRFVTYDPKCYYNPDAKIFDPARLTHADDDIDEAQKDAEPKGEAFNAHEIGKFARRMSPKAVVNSTATGASLALASLISPARVKVGGIKAYPVRAQIVALAESGAGKTTLLSALKGFVAHAGGCVEAPKTTAALREALRAVGCTRNEDAKGRTTGYTPKAEAQKMLVVTDEAGQVNSAKRNDPNALEYFAFKRECFADKITLTGLKEVRTVTCPAWASFFDASTPEQYARSLMGIDTKSGEGRRMLEFWEHNEEQGKGALAALDALRNSVMRPEDEEYILDLVEKCLTATGPAFDEKSGAFEYSATDDGFAAFVSVWDRLEHATTLDMMRDGITLLWNTAALCAIIREATAEFEQKRFNNENIVLNGEIKAEDFEAAHDIVRAVAYSRAKLNSYIERENNKLYKTPGEIETEIKEMLAKKPRTDALKRWLDRRTEAYRIAFEKLKAEGFVKVDKIDKKHDAFRLATDKERDEAEKEREAAKENEKAVNECTDYIRKQGGAAYCDESEAGKEARVVKVFQWVDANKGKCEEGNRNRWGFICAQSLHRTGMFDYISRGLLENKLCGAGLPEKEIKTVMRKA